jgi:threonine/homoserine/homoserine lactone efflux protein
MDAQRGGIRRNLSLVAGCVVGVAVVVGIVRLGVLDKSPQSIIEVGVIVGALGLLLLRGRSR